MFGLGWTEIILLAVVGLFVFGPERLPTVIADATKVLRQLRGMAQGMGEDIKAELGPEFAELDLAALNPRTLMSHALLGDTDRDSGGAEPVPVGSVPAELLPASGQVFIEGEIPPYDTDAT